MTSRQGDASGTVECAGQGRPAGPGWPMMAAPPRVVRP